MEVICLQSEALESLIDAMYEKLMKKEGRTKSEWMDAQETMQLLGVKSKTTLQQYRDEGKILFSQPSRKVIKYHRQSVEQFLTNHSKQTF